MQEQQEKPEETAPVKSKEQIRKEQLATELTMKKLLYSGKNVPYVASQRDEKGHALDITEAKPFSNNGRNTRQIRRGNERVIFSTFQDSIQTTFERKTSSGKMLKKYTKKDGLQNDRKVQGWVKA